MVKRERALVDALVATARAEILRDSRIDSCIASRRIALEVLRRCRLGGGFGASSLLPMVG